MSILGSWAPDWADSALDTAGKGASSAVDLVNDGANTIGKGLDIIPVIGPLYSALWTHVTSPLEVGNKILQGVPIDQVALQTLQEQVQVARTVAPYAQMVMQLVPGVGPIASGAISAGIALANGQTIDAALVEGVKGALPGGPLAQAAFSAGKAAMDGESAASIGLKAGEAIGAAAGVQVSPAAAKALGAGLNVANALQQGASPSRALVGAAIAELPASEQLQAAQELANGNTATLSDMLLDNARGQIANQAAKGNALMQRQISKQLKEALNVGMAIGTGQRFQKAFAREVAENPSNLNALAEAGAMAARLANEVAMAAALAATKPRISSVKNVTIAKPVLKAGSLASVASKLKGRTINEFPWGDVPWQEMQGFAGEEENAPIDNPEAKYGFQVGTGLMLHAITRNQFTTIRNALSADAKAGFDLATAMHIGRVISEPKGDNPLAQAAYQITRGLSKGIMPGERKALLLAEVVSNKQAREGAALAIEEIKAVRE